MITKQTVFVLGAGVSMPYGFPSGNTLVEQICSATAGTRYEDDPTALIDKGVIGRIIRDTFGEGITEEFGKALFLSQKLSIDSFLEHRSEFMDIGKLTIALFILRKEIETNLYAFENRKKGCYQYLLDKMNSSWDEFPHNKVGFITFNYDRSLEQFLFASLQNTYGTKDRECADHINMIPIIHVHGLLGKLPWQSPEGIQYGAMLQKYSNLHESSTIAPSILASKQIKIITEDQSTSEEFQSAYKLLSEADYIYFLGFGYHPTNLERLRIHELPFMEEIRNILGPRRSRLMGTGLGMETAEMEAVINRWFINIQDNNSDSLLFLKRYARFD